MSEWQKVKIGDVCTITKGATGIKKAIAGDYPMVTLAEERTTHNEFQFDCEAVIIPLVSSTGHGHASMKRVHYQKGKFAIGSILCAVVPNETDFLNPKYLHIYLSYLKDKLLVPLMRGAANVSLSISNIKTVEVIVPPIERQLEIIELEKVLRSQKEKLDEQNNFQQSHLTLLRQQILQDAISGKLTADWRAENPDTESAIKLLEKIKAEKEKLIAEKKIKKEKPLPKVTEDEVLFELPAGWEWCRLGEIVQHNSGKTLDSGRNKGELREYITTSNLYWGFFNLDVLKKMPIKDDELEKCMATKGDLLICEGGEAGRSAIWNEDYDICFQNHIHRVRPYCSISSFYIYWFFQKINLSGEINKYRKGMGISNLSGKSLALIPIPLPPRAEQRTIVAKVERLMEYVSQLEEKIAQNANNAETLMQAFLGEVFRK